MRRDSVVHLVGYFNKSMCFSTVTVKKTGLIKTVHFKLSVPQKTLFLFLVLNGVLCAQFVITMNNTNLGDTVPLAVVFLVGGGTGEWHGFQYKYEGMYEC
jgi:hypothetical protein